MDAKIFNFMVHSMFPMINELYEYRHTANEEMIKLIEEAKNYLNNINRNNINDNVNLNNTDIIYRINNLENYINHINNRLSDIERFFNK